jgi:ADP-ribosyl-[dinitrogen reductase] hydrolase
MHSVDTELKDRIAGGLVGLLVGDALGVPYEFHAAADIPEEERIEFDPPSDFRRSHHLVPSGTWSDDGAQALCLLASLLECNRLDLRDFGKRLVAWYDEGYMAVDCVTFDIGVCSGKAIRAIREGVPPESAGADGPYDNGNGSLMRVLPLALWHQGSDEELARDAHRQSMVTHAHLRSQVCCALYCLWARRVLFGAVQPWQDAVHSLRTIYKSYPEASEELEWSIRPDAEPIGHGSGYVVDTLRSALMLQNVGDFEATIRAAIRLGGDTDTTACVAGGIAGLRTGLAGIPTRWKTGLRGFELYSPLLAQLLEQCSARNA